MMLLLNRCQTFGNKTKLLNISANEVKHISKSNGWSGLNFQKMSALGQLTNIILEVTECTCWILDFFCKIYFFRPLATILYVH